MKQRQSIANTIMVAVLMLGGTGSASAQFGSLMNKAKNAAKNEVRKQVNDAKNDVKESVMQKAETTVNEQVANVEGIQVLYGSDNKLVGTYSAENVGSAEFDQIIAKDKIATFYFSASGYDVSMTFELKSADKGTGDMLNMFDVKWERVK